MLGGVAGDIVICEDTSGQFPVGSVTVYSYIPKGSIGVFVTGFHAVKVPVCGVIP